MSYRVQLGRSLCTRIFKSIVFVSFLILYGITAFAAIPRSSNRGFTAEPGVVVKNIKVTVKGVVTDSSGAPLTGASVTIKDTKIGMTTGIDGRFSLMAADNSGVVIVSYTGYVTQEIAFSGETDLQIKMVSEQNSEHEVIVVGYGTLKRKDISSSVSSVKGAALVKSTSPNVSNAISGKIAGVLARQSDGRPGSFTDFNIRGMGTPLYVIDGIPKDGGQFNNINMEDIEDIVVLKDGAATAIWGVGAANGVIQITTKKGRKNQKSQINLNTYYGGQDWTRFPKTANAGQYYEGQIEADVNQWLVNPNRTGTPTYTISKEEFEKWKAGVDSGYQSFDWSSFIERYAPMQSANLNVSGGSDNVNYYLGLGHLKQDGAIRNFVFQRTNFQTNVDINVSKSFKVGASINARLEQRKNPGEPGGDDIIQPLTALYRNIPTERPYANDNPKYPANNGPRVSYNFALLDYDQTGFFEDAWRVFQGNAYAEYKTPIKGLVAKVTGNYYYANRLLDIQEYTYKTYTYDRVLGKYNEFFTNPNPYREKINGFVEEKIYQAYLNYDRTFNNKHSVNATAGIESNERYEGSTQLSRGNPSSNFIRLIRTSELRDINDNLAERGSLSFLGRANYTYDNRYLIGFALRRDKSSAFQNALAAKFFPGVSVAWNAHNESFLKPVFSTAFSSFKLRASYGIAGLVDYGVSGSYQPGYNFPAGVYVFGNELINGTSYRETPSVNITWTESKYINVGFDAGFFNNKLNVTADLFNRKQTGQLVTRRDVLIPSEVAQPLPLENLNATQTLGIDGEVSYANKIGDFTYSIGVNGVYARSRALTRYKEYLGWGSSWDEYRNAAENRWAAQGWGYIADGQFQSLDEIRNYAVDQDGQGNTTLLPGDVKYKDMNGDGVLTALDQRPIAKSTGLPLYSYGVNLSGTWKGLDLTLNFQGAGDYYFIKANELQRPFLNNGNIPSLLLDRWYRSDPFDPNSEWIPGKYPTIRRNGIDNNLAISTFNTTNVWYLRLRNFEIGYTLPEKWMKKAGINKVRVYVNSYNTLTFTNIEVIDPELSSGGGIQYPQTKMWSFGLNVSF